MSDPFENDITPDALGGYYIRCDEDPPLSCICDFCDDPARYAWRNIRFCTDHTIEACEKKQIPIGSTLIRVPVYEAE